MDLSIDLVRVGSRFGIARMAGEDAEDGGNGWNEAKCNAILRSWRDIPGLVAEINILRAQLIEEQYDTKPRRAKE